MIPLFPSSLPAISLLLPSSREHNYIYQLVLFGPLYIIYLLPLRSLIFSSIAGYTGCQNVEFVSYKAY